MPKTAITISSILLAALAVVAVPALSGAQVRRGALPPEKSRPQVAEAARTELAALRGMQIVTPVEIAFSDAESYDNFAAGRLPVGFVLRNRASGQTIRLDPRAVTEGFRPSRDRSRATIYLVIGDLLAPVWDEAGCTETQTGTESAADGTGVTITLTYVPCAAAAAARGRAGDGGGRPNPCGWIPHPACSVLSYAEDDQAITVTGTRIPRNLTAASPVVVRVRSARVTISTGPSQTGEGVGQRLLARLRETGATNISVPDVLGKGAGSPKAAGF